MSSKIGKITIYVTQTRSGQGIAVRTAGKRGSVNLNTLTLDQSYNSQSPSTDASSFWRDVLTKVQALIP